MLKKYLILMMLLSCCLTFAGGCTPFQHLTVIQEDKNAGPKAVDCGSCHVAQFAEWSGSPHAAAFENAVFAEAYRDLGDEECLACHAPLEIRQGKRVGRLFNRDEGVTCISCHLSEGKMHGPHKSSALLHPHPVQEADDFYLGVDICASCHGETYDEYQGIAEKREVPICLACHAASRQRTASQGTNFMSNTLVAFEDVVDTRSHLISLDRLAAMSGLVAMAVMPSQQDVGNGMLEVELTNNLPHSLPTGTFGEKSIRLVVRLWQADHILSENSQVVSDERQSMLAGAVRRIAISASGPVEAADRLEMRLERHASPDSSRPAILLDSKTITLPWRQ